MTLAEFRRDIRTLREREPLEKPVRVRRMIDFPRKWTIEGDLAACCWITDTAYEIALDAASTNLRDDLAHEWAHLKSGSEKHGKRWALCYARIRLHFWPE
jgi:hypothetical protein